MSDINSITVALIRELMKFIVCNGSINKGIKRVYGSVTVVHLRHTLVRHIWTAWIFLYSSLGKQKLTRFESNNEIGLILVHKNKQTKQL